MDLADVLVKEGRALRYVLRIPPRPSTDKYPVLFFLHGYDEGPPTEIRRAIARHGPLRPNNGVATLEHFIIVAPQLPQRGDLWYGFANPVREIARDVQAAYNADPQRTYLTGFSFGANGVFDLGLEQPDLWAALWAVDHTRVPRAKSPEPVWLCFGDIARHRKPQITDVLSRSADANEGDPDVVFDDRGADHVGSARVAYQDERIYSWLLSKRLP